MHGTEYWGGFVHSQHYSFDDTHGIGKCRVDIGVLTLRINTLPASLNDGRLTDDLKMPCNSKTVKFSSIYHSIVPVVHINFGILAAAEGLWHVCGASTASPGPMVRALGQSQPQALSITTASLKPLAYGLFASLGGGNFKNSTKTGVPAHLHIPFTATSSLHLVGLT